ncbi:MAG: hypothetical protein AAGI45_23225 [Cyanobacteria bacterium P01_H01_bin.26]
MDGKLSRLNEAVEVDLSQFGDEPLLLGRVLDDPLHLLLGGGLLSLFALAAPGAGWILAAGVAAATANDIRWAFTEDVEGDDFDGETIDTDAAAVDPVEQLKADSPDNWIDTAVEQGFDVIPGSNAQQWPPSTPTPAAVNSRLNTLAYNEARDLVIEGPDALLDLLGDQTPDWVRSAAAARTSPHAHETPSVTGGDTLPVTPVTPKSDSKVTASDTLINGFAQNHQSNACHRQSQQGSDTFSVTAEDCKTYVSGLTLSEFKSQLCPEGGGLNPQDLNAKEGRIAAVQYLREFRASYGKTPIEFAVWWGWGLTKKGGTSPGAEKYRFVANFVADAFDKLWSD